jgi:hypothetical protein
MVWLPYFGDGAFVMVRLPSEDTEPQRLSGSSFPAFFEGFLAFGAFLAGRCYRHPSPRPAISTRAAFHLDKQQLKSDWETLSRDAID